ncbi:MAG: ATP-grasp domain-containing protein [Nitrospirota bacterium]
MKNILVSGASSILGYGILRSLKQSGKSVRLIGTTIYADSVAQYFCDVFELAPPTDDPGYIDWLLKAITKHHVELIIPGIEVDVYKWIEHLPILEKTGVKALLNNRDLILLCKDKWSFHEKLIEMNTPYAIDTSLESDFDVLVDKFGLPFLLKPRRGFGSKGIVTIDSSKTFLKHQHAIGPLLMAQPLIGNENEEFTTSAFCDGNGSYFASMTMKRRLSKSGFTEKAEVVTMDEIQRALVMLCAYFKPIGPTNFQFRKHDGGLKLLEINPRISSSTSIRTAFGYNECNMALEFYLEGKKPTQPLIRKGRAVRYIEDLIFYENRNHL